MYQVSDSIKHERKQRGRRKRISIAVLTIAILFCQLILSESFVSNQKSTTFSRIHGTFYSPTISKQSTRKPTKEGVLLQQQSTRIVLAAAAAASAATPSNDGGDSLSFSQPPPTSKLQRFRRALPLRTMKRNPLDALDKLILQTCIPSILNLAVVPLVNAVDTFYVGRLGVALMLAGQSAANQASFTIFFLIAFVPNITAPLVARAVASGDEQDAQERVCESIFLCNVLGMLGTLLLVGFPRLVLSTLLLPADAPAMDFAAPYLRWRALGMVPSLIGATGSAAYRGLLNTVTPLKVSLMTNAVNLVLDPLLIFVSPFSYVGAAMATAAAETLGGITYIHLLLRRKLARWKLLLRPPSWKALWPLLQGGAAMLLRQLALNVGFLVATRRAQQMDPTGVSGAAYGITMQIYAIGIICLVGMQNAAAALVPSSRVKYGDESARQTADRLLGWSTLMGTILGVGQFLLLPVLVPLFSTLDSVKEAARTPTLIASFIHIVNGPVLAGEGILMGVGSYRALAMITMTYVASMMACLTFTPLGQRLDGIMWSILLSSIVQQMGVVGHYLKIGPLALQKVNGSNESKRDAVTVEESAEDTETAAPTNRS
ncbi:MATE efflux family protein [Nitzschia inconspicua]|uniref:MATE efflux family protein n=1 Tax=Nitzschia inconspicua TaxID=303405 RepID=A0A9K3PSM1_9STRA|nr:MATE efflux family protein [Nitzschia inconspicua]